MGLEVRHIRAEHTHENLQFRRVAKRLIAFFAEQNWDGLLIGNPDAEDFSRFRADAVLLYNHGLIIIDFKDYQGNIHLPPNDREFQNTRWYNETTSDNERIVIRGGNRFINPFMQIKSYRSVMYEIIDTHSILKNNLDPSRTCAINLFSGPITLSRETPRSIPYYQIRQESDFHNFLYDYSSPNSYSEESANAFRAIFPSSEWKVSHEGYEPKEAASKEQVVKVESDLEESLKSFMEKEGAGIFVLESMFENERDDWVNYLLQQSHDFEIPQTETWIHSSRIRRKVKTRSGIVADSLYATIYGGMPKLNDPDENNEKPEEEVKEEEILQEVIPIKKDNWLDEKSLIILHEAHLVSRSLHQSDLLRFGSGRLLEDLIKFLDFDQKPRKLICIGDPYSLSYGKAEESAIAIESLKELFDGEIMNYRSEPKAELSSEKMALRMLLADSIDNGVFNDLKYSFDSNELIRVEKQEVIEKLGEWFSTPLDEEPENTMLVYSNKDAGKINLWIKEHLLSNGADLAKGDLLLINNNIQIPDETGLSIPTKVYNGMYLTVNEIQDHKAFYIRIKQSNTPVNLYFKKLNVKCLSISNKPDADVWILENYFKGEGGLSKYEQIALRVFISQKVEAYKKEHSFKESEEYNQFVQDQGAKDLSKEIKDLKERLDKKEKVKTKLEQKERAYRKIEKRYKKRHHQKALLQVSANDPFINAAQVIYGWSITVHKAVGSNFSNICFNTFQGDNRGIRNANYYRWLYSGLSTSNKTVFVINPREVDPLEDCLFEDLAGDGWQEKQTSKSDLFEFNDFEIDEKYKPILSEDINSNAKAIACLLAGKLTSKNLAFKEAKRINDYLTKIYFSKGDEASFSLVIAINNKGNGKVSSVRIEKTDNITTEEFDAFLQQLKEEPSSDSEPINADLPTDFRFSIYQKWQKNCSENNAKLSLEASHSYQDIFVMVKGDQKIRFQVIYNGKGFITKVNVKEKTDSDIGIDLHNWLLNE
jgi:hypothetical protein